MGKQSPSMVPAIDLQQASANTIQSMAQNQAQAQSQYTQFGNTNGVYRPSPYSPRYLSGYDDYTYSGGSIASAMANRVQPAQPPKPNYAAMVKEAPWEKTHREKMERETKFAEEAKAKADEMMHNLKAKWHDRT